MIWCCDQCSRAFKSKRGAVGHCNLTHNAEQNTLFEIETLPDGYTIAGKKTRGTPSETPLPTSNLSPRAEELNQVLSELSPPLRPALRAQVVAAAMDSETFFKESHELENILDDFGLSIAQIRQVRRRVLEAQPKNPIQQLYDLYGIQMPSGQGMTGLPGMTLPWLQQGQEKPLNKSDVTEIIETILDRREGQQQRSDPEIQSLKEMIMDLRNQRDRDFAVEDAISKALASIKPELDELRRERTLTGSGGPYESSVNRLIDVVAQVGTNLQEGFKPVFGIAQAVQLHQLDFSPQQIVDLIRQQDTNRQEANLSADEKTKRAELEKIWAK